MQKQQEPTLSWPAEKISSQRFILPAPTFTICCGVSNDDEILDIGGCLVILLYHRLNQKATALQLEITHNSSVRLFSLAEAAPTPPGCQAWEPGLLDKMTYGQSLALQRALESSCLAAWLRP
jgi:hypothetical protein